MRKKRPYTCVNCGIGFESVIKDAKFCGKHCSNQYKQTQGNAELNSGQYAIQCPNNEGVVCDRPYCYKCGWNPVVAQRRMDNFRRRKCAV